MPSFSALAIYILAAIAAASHAAPIRLSDVTVGDVAPEVDALDEVAPAFIGARAVDIPKAEAGDAVLEHVAPFTDALGARQLDILNEVAAPTTSISARCDACMAESIVADTLSQVQPLLEKIESLKVIDIAIETLEPVLNEVIAILSGATDKVNALVGTGENAVDDVSVEELAKQVAPLINTVLGALDCVLKLTKNEDITKLLSGAAAPLGDLTHSITSLVGGGFASTILPMISNTLGPLVSQLDCADKFDFLGNLEQLAGKIVGVVPGLL
ncbi:hypothetical protein Moror_9919 [Moniliophthora roreri MCA 2997]|uniref:Uncharacterized protein n=1 Tax=Moniliophthora roreri (strain MCA 2997) TaxID=1381753 RepID=V2WZT6_MONRO|nr:hypothetical protein Moror_9919 [Moniliophthora roreri MCA 2997]